MSPMSHHQAILISEWGPTTFYLNGASTPDETLLEQLKRRNIRIEPATVEALVGDGPHLSHIQLSDGRADAVDALFITPRNYLNSTLASKLGCEISDAPLGSIVQVDETRMTSIPDVYAAGDITRGAHTVIFASADGAMAALAMHRSLVFEDREGVNAE